jgi:lipopolysaccharide/colanic/teichoic acid biosynthesis glycosyltransferase
VTTVSSGSTTGGEGADPRGSAAPERPAYMHDALARVPLDVEPEAGGNGDQGEVVLDLTRPARPLIIDLVAPVAAPPPDTIALDDLEDTGLLAATRWQRLIKRAIDVSGSALLILVLSPLLAVTALSVLLTSTGPAIYRQERVGRGGRPFTMYKFRSMVANAHEVRHLHAEANECDGPVFKIRDDPRVTPVGRVIRRLSVDELPQLFNVLRGDMSLVGPRPPLPEEYVVYGDRERLRTLVTPGVTCIWQVSGRSDVDFDRWVDMDIEYIRTWSLGLDLRLILKSIPAVLSGRGAY